MFNKLKKAVKYIVKKIKQGVEIMAKTINDAKCAVAKTAEVGANVVSDIYKARCEVTIKKLDMVERAGSAVCNGVKGAGSAVCNGVKGAGSAVYNIVANPHNRITAGVIGICLGVGLSAGFIITGVIDTKRTEV